MTIDQRKKLLDNIRKEVDFFKGDYRLEKGAFLAWFLKNIFKLSEQESVDSVVDGAGDKGIDGIWFSEEEDELYVFQSEFSPKDDVISKETKIREFLGVKDWFRNSETVSKLKESSANEEVKNRLVELNVNEKIDMGKKVNYVYITNKLFDNNATELINATLVDAYDINRILDLYHQELKPEIKNEPISLKVSSNGILEYAVDEKNKCIIASVAATELLKLQGIDDKSLFSQNVRLWTGNTRVNKDLGNTLRNQDEHRMFFLYHNGISITCSSFAYDDVEKQIKIERYQVINGCQSLTNLYQNRNRLTNDISLLVKFIQVEKPEVVAKITKNANNQNAITLKDLKSNDRVQIALQNSFNEFYKNRLFYIVKRGEDSNSASIKIDDACQLIMAFYFQKPERTHLKSEFYGDMYEKIFSRNIDCHKIYLAFLVKQIIDDNREKIEMPQVRDYGLARFNILSTMKLILENDPLGKQIIDAPQSYLTESKEQLLKNALTQLFKLVVLDVNAFIKECASGEFFDYKNLFKKKDFCKKLSETILTDQRKSIVRHPDDQFCEIYKEQIKKVQ